MGEVNLAPNCNKIKQSGVDITSDPVALLLSQEEVVLLALFSIHRYPCWNFHLKWPRFSSVGPAQWKLMNSRPAKHLRRWLAADWPHGRLLIPRQGGWGSFGRSRSNVHDLVNSTANVCSWPQLGFGLLTFSKFQLHPFLPGIWLGAWRMKQRLERQPIQIEPSKRNLQVQYRPPTRWAKPKRTPERSHCHAAQWKLTAMSAIRWRRFALSLAFCRSIGYRWKNTPKDQRLWGTFFRTLPNLENLGYKQYLFAWHSHLFKCKVRTFVNLSHSFEVLMLWRCGNWVESQYC